MLQLDATPIRTIIRSQPGLVVLRDGKIIDKRAYADFPSVEGVSTYLRSLPQMQPHGPSCDAHLPPLGVGCTAALSLPPLLGEKAPPHRPSAHQEAFTFNQIILFIKVTMRKNIVAGNWKMNKTLSEGISFIGELKAALAGKSSTVTSSSVLPSSTSHLSLRKLKVAP